MTVTLWVARINFRHKIVPEITQMGRHNGDWQSAVVSSYVDPGQLRPGRETPFALSRANNRFWDLPDSFGTTRFGARSRLSPLCPSLRCIPDRIVRHLSGCCWPIDEGARHLKGRHSAKAGIFSGLFRLLNLACTRANRRFAAPLQANDRHRNARSWRP